MNDQADLDAYLTRIGYSGKRAPTLKTLCAIVELHPAAIPFENLAPFSHEEVRIDLASLERKLLHEHRGGYCFEQNTLLLAALRALGFAASGLSARILWNLPEDAVPARGHMLLRVELDGETYLVDVGFGGLTLTAPLRLGDERRQATPHEPFRIARGDDGDLRLQAELRGEWKTLYRFDLSPAFPSDYAVSNYYLSTHPHSHFRTGLLAARSVPGRRFALADRRLSVHSVGGDSETRMLESPLEMRDVLERTFDIRLPTGDAVEHALAGLFS